MTLLEDWDSSKANQYRESNSYYQFIKSHFNIGYKFVTVQGDFKEKLTLMLAAGDYPDIIPPRYTDVLKSYAEAGALIDLGPLFQQYAPNFLKRSESRIPVWEASSGMNDGKIWFYTIYAPDVSRGNSVTELEWVVRSDILQQQNYPNIKDENDIYNVLKKGLADNPTTDGLPTIAFSHPLASWGTNGLQCITYSYNLGRLSHLTFNHGSVYDYDQNKFIDVTSEYSYKDGLAFFNKLFREGMYDKDSITDDYDAYVKKMTTGRVLSNFFYNWDWQSWNTELEKAGKPYRYVSIPLMLSSQYAHGEKKVYPVGSGEIWSGCSITKNAKYPERIANLINWQATEEGMVLCGWGVEGQQYTVVNGKRVATAEHFEKLKNDPDQAYLNTIGGPNEFGFYLGMDPNGQAYQMYNDADYVAQDMDPIVKDVMAKYGWSNISDMYLKNKNFQSDLSGEAVDIKAAEPSYTDDQRKAWEKIDATTHDFTMKLITAKTPEDFDRIFTDMIKARNDQGEQGLIEAWNTEYASQKEKYGIK